MAVGRGHRRDPFEEILNNEFEAPGFPRWGSIEEEHRVKPKK